MPFLVLLSLIGYLLCCLVLHILGGIASDVHRLLRTLLHNLLEILVCLIQELLEVASFLAGQLA